MGFSGTFLFFSPQAFTLVSFRRISSVCSQRQLPKPEDVSLYLKEVNYS